MDKPLAVITGGTKGIGKALIESFAAKGFQIATCARDEEDLAELKQDILRKYEFSIHTLACDLSIRSQLRDFVEFVQLIGHPVEVLINNTGRFIPGEILKEEDGALEDMINTNLYSAYHVTRGIVPLMKGHRKGYIFNMCSIASFMAYPNGGSYAITKFALLGMSKVLREELKESGIRVSSVMPGATYTPSWEGAGVEESRIMQASDIATIITSSYDLSAQSVVEEIILRPQLGDL
jgi:short-subunit dehydrogenase